VTIAGCAQAAQGGRHERGLDLRGGKASGLQFAAGGVDECEQDRQMPLRRASQRKLPASWPRSISGCRSASTGRWRRRSSACGSWVGSEAKPMS